MAPVAEALGAVPVGEVRVQDHKLQSPKLAKVGQDLTQDVRDRRHRAVHAAGEGQKPERGDGREQSRLAQAQVETLCGRDGVVHNRHKQITTRVPYQ